MNDILWDEFQAPSLIANCKARQPSDRHTNYRVMTIIYFLIFWSTTDHAFCILLFNHKYSRSSILLLVTIPVLYTGVFIIIILWGHSNLGSQFF